MIGQKKLRGTDYGSSRAADFTSEAFKSLARDNPILNSNTVRVQLGSGDTQVSHGLGQAVQGWIVINKEDNCNVWQSQSTNSLPEKFILMKTDVVGVWITFLFF